MDWPFSIAESAQYRGDDSAGLNVSVGFGQRHGGGELIGSIAHRLLDASDYRVACDQVAGQRCCPHPVDRVIAALLAHLEQIKRKRGLDSLLTRRVAQMSNTCRRSPKPTRQLVPSPVSMVAVRWLIRTMVPTCVCR